MVARKNGWFAFCKALFKIYSGEDLDRLMDIFDISCSIVDYQNQSRSRDFRTRIQAVVDQHILDHDWTNDEVMAAKETFLYGGNHNRIAKYLENAVNRGLPELPYYKNTRIPKNKGPADDRGQDEIIEIVEEYVSDHPGYEEVEIVQEEEVPSGYEEVEVIEDDYETPEYEEIEVVQDSEGVTMYVVEEVFLDDVDATSYEEVIDDWQK